MSLTRLDVVLSIFATFFTIWLRRKISNRHKHPPGPPGLPLIGNLADVPTRDAWVVYQQWSKEYGSDIIRLNVLGTNIVVLNSLELANDLFDKRSAIYSSRAHLTMLDDLVGFSWALSSTKHNERFKEMRKTLHYSFNSEAVKEFYDIEAKAALELVQKIVERPADFTDHVRHMAGSIILRTGYGIQVQRHNDSYIELAETAMHAMGTVLSAGSYLVDMFPILKHVPDWLPGAEFKRQANAWRPYAIDLAAVPFKEGKKRVEDGTAPHNCAIAALLDRLADASDEVQEDGESIIECALGSMYGGGADTTVSVLTSFLLAMVLFPDVQVKARAQLDAVVGRSRLPTIADRPLLPYIDAIFNEIMRWAPVLRLGIPHLLSEDDIYQGYYLPKDTIVVANVWAMFNDEAVYPEPRRFKPERFMLDGKLNPNVRDPDTAAFGFGRRVCPGRFMAKDSAWIAIAMILATLEIKPVVDVNGVPLLPAGEYKQGLIAFPEPFAADIRVRSDEHRGLLSEASHDE